MKKGTIISLGDEALTEGELGTWDKILFDVLIYWYKNEGYEGSGFAVWRVNGEWAYTSLGHCSCYGGTDEVQTANNAKFPLDKIKELAKNDDYNGGSVIVKYLEDEKYV